jgi:hypothetical protein
VARLETFGGRLERAIHEFGPRPGGWSGARGTVKGFHNKIKDLVPPGAGASYQTLYRILANEADPSPAFIDAALSCLPEVRREWLVHGEGAITHADAEAATVTAAVSVPDFRDTLAPRLVEAVLTGVGFPAVGEITHIPAWAAPLAELWVELPNEHAIAEALAGPLRAYPEINVEALDRASWLRDYILAMTPVLFQLAAEAERQGRQRQDLPPQDRQGGDDGEA